MTATGLGVLLGFSFYVMIIAGIIVFGVKLLNRMKEIAEAQKTSALAQAKIAELLKKQHDTQNN